MIFEDGYIKIPIEDLAVMIAHKCRHCEYRVGLCSETNGCEIGILDWLKNEVCDN